MDLSSHVGRLEGSPGWIALDIDGTITSHRHFVPPKTVAYLALLAERGWKLLFVTGRIYSYSAPLFNSFSFPYYFAVQNGADLFAMPGTKLICRNYLSASCLPLVEELCRTLQYDYILYGGYEQGDFCYYRPARYTERFLEYLRILEGLSKEPWRAVENFVFAANEEFSLIKCFGSQEEMEQLSLRLAPYEEKFVGTMLKDPIGENLYLMLITHPSATKGGILRQVAAFAPGPTIGAGDDLNDLSLLQAADVAIAMEGAPVALLAAADIVAPSAGKEGIVTVLSALTGVMP